MSGEPLRQLLLTQGALGKMKEKFFF